MNEPNMNTDTPRTKERQFHDTPGDDPRVYSDFAEELEREVNTYRELISHAIEYIESCCRNEYGEEKPYDMNGEETNWTIEEELLGKLREALT